ncbi:MAG: tetratricopeptide repeat protein [Anaerolineae bacterium]|jgi:tetratricopeptide (TPR) repeat protein
MSKVNSGLGRFRIGDDPCRQASVYLEAGRHAMRQGDLAEARRFFRAAVESDPDCHQAWLQLAWLAPNPRSRRVLLQRVLALRPDHRAARAELLHLQGVPAGVADRPQRRSTSGLRLWLAGLAVVAALLILVAVLVWGPVGSTLARWLPTPTPVVTPTPTLTPAQIATRFAPELESVVRAGDWDRALQLVRMMRGVDPDGDEVRRRAIDTWMRYGRYLVGQGQVARALEQFDAVVALAPHDADAALWSEVSRLYLDGDDAVAGGDLAAALDHWRRAHDLLADYGDLVDRLGDAYLAYGEMALGTGDLAAAIEMLTEGRQRLPANDSVTDLLATVYLQRGIARQENGKLKAARVDLEAALALRPDDAEAQTHYDEVMYILFPPKRIEINLTTQRFYAWEGDTLIWKFPTSTGLRGRDTAAGHYEVLDKIPMAYSSVWNLQMPYWLGIYYVGNIENGIHALPIRPDGTVMWGGLLGQRASYGCVILSTEAARLVYKWAEIGTEVHIHY